MKLWVGILVYLIQMVITALLYPALLLNVLFYISFAVAEKEGGSKLLPLRSGEFGA